MKLINENLILLDMNLQSKDDIISCIADTLENNQRLCDKQQYRRCLFKRGRNIYSHGLQHRYTACIVIGRQAYISGLSSTTKSNSMG